MERSYQRTLLLGILFKFIGRCKLINYWLYDEVKQILNSETRDIYNETISKLHKAWTHYNNSAIHIAEQYKCKPESNIPSKDDIEDKKKIHEHCLNYYEISKEADNKDKCQEYKASIKELNLPYKKFDSLFSEDKKKHLSYYNKCKSYNPENIPDGLTCPQVVKDPSREEEAVPKEHHSAKANLEETEAEERLPSLDVEGELGRGTLEGKVRGYQGEVPAGVGDIQEQVRGDERPGQIRVSVEAEAPTSMGREKQNLATDLEAGQIPLHSQMDGQTDDVPIPTEPPASNPMVMPAGLSLFGIASLSTILYKVCKN
ncbi:variable surface protein Vir4 [Plasmodium vivax India VII]|uniref:Variable surface protein Vir4-related n=2 Tax=Plasmodium vivax TaxID=5855 RepID=A5KCL9_PLAVS|nr:variable surface protein Vir4-related [Plasmodium vivax]EDL42891.1 variable surface protein Vir4-related [Plasmodium vivax]KMZ82870.1 variable surface protein Vir4 [Plasmodium vivax India VII]|eukprot:XP_001612665.1 variable surface protein Vir4-related [Plasmodium vivax Sal-1]